MRLSRKHSNEQVISMYDFTGGLNSSVSPENIAENQLMRVSNLEVNQGSGLLTTVSGTKRLLRTDFKIFYMIYDRINDCGIIIADNINRDTYTYTLDNGLKKIGALTGKLKPIFTSWDKGVLIASGGKLQYFDGTTLVTLNESPEVSSGVFVRNGRVIVADTKENKIYFSEVGNEKRWITYLDEEVTDNKAKWLETGYKDGGRFIGMANLSDNIIIFKDNGYVYRLSGNYPDWRMQEVSRQVDCAGRLSFCSLPNTVIVYGERNIQLLDTTQDYSDVKTASISTNVANILKDVPLDAEIIFLPPLNQIWLIGDNGFVLVYDCTYKSFFTRKFHSQIVTVTYHKNEVIIVKEHGLYKLDPNYFSDEDDSGEVIPLLWSFTSRRIVSHNEYLLKRAQINVIPSFPEAGTDFISVGRISLNIPTSARKYADDSEFIFNNESLIFDYDLKIFPEVALTNSIRQIARTKAIQIKGNGRHGRLIINSITMNVAEV